MRTLRGSALAARPDRLTSVVPAWLPGNMAIAFEAPAAFQYALDAARAQARRGVGLAAILRPTSGRPADIEVYLQGGLVGTLPASLAATLCPALDAYRRAHQGRLVACPAAFDDTRPALLRLHLDHEALGLDHHLANRVAQRPA